MTRAPRKLYIDLGANVGAVAGAFASEHPDFDIYCFEANKDLIPAILEQSIRVKRPFFIVWAAAWIEDTQIELYQSERHEASTVISGKIEYEQYGWPQINYNRPTLVPAINFGGWLLRTTTPDDEIIVKMDIEGAEYALLESMLKDGSIDCVSLLRCEWHIDRYPSIPRSRHETLLGLLSDRVTMETWY